MEHGGGPQHREYGLRWKFLLGLPVLEAQFNKDLRTILRRHGMVAIWVREADVVGVADLLVFKGQQIKAWLELKVDDEEVRPSQREFLRARDAEAGNAFVLRYISHTGNILVFRADAETPMAIARLESPWGEYLDTWRAIAWRLVRKDSGE